LLAKEVLKEPREKTVTEAEPETKEGPIKKSKKEEALDMAFIAGSVLGGSEPAKGHSVTPKSMGSRVGQEQVFETFAVNPLARALNL